MNEVPQRDLEIFTAAIQLAVGERAACLERMCDNDGELRQRVEALLKTHARLGHFLEQPLAEPTKSRPSVPTGESPGDRIGRYKLLQQIGEGGCGVVYMAEQDEPVRRQVALKIIKAGMGNAPWPDVSKRTSWKCPVVIPSMFPNQRRSRK